MSFSYLLRKIKDQDFTTTPFKHIEVFDFFDSKHFQEITKTREVALREFDRDESLIEEMKEIGFQSIPFPGTTQNERAYLDWRKGKVKHQNTDTCEGFGITFRLIDNNDSLLKEINEFFNSDEFLGCIAEKFDIEIEETYPDNGLQKYLDGYEISPHPDIRRKALTYMININPSEDSETLNYHTHYLEFSGPYKYVEEYWKYNAHSDRCWVPWSWCETIKQQTRNNSLVMFSPSHDTMHAIRTRYNHLNTQRTQFYGNLWFNEDPVIAKPHWHDFVITATDERFNSVSTMSKIKTVVPFRKELAKVKQLIRR